jgi:tocopherol O-methyltransferase
MTKSLYQQIQHFYDTSSGLWEQVWGEHMHHGYYGLAGTDRKERRQAQIDLIEELLSWAQIKQACRVLDVGCGIGGSSLYLAQKFSAAVTGITLSPVQAARATERAESASIQIGASSAGSSAQFWVADALNAPFPDHVFDLVWSLESGEHMPDKAKFLQECYRVLKPGGTLILATWCHRPTDVHPLTEAEGQQLAELYRVYCLPYVLPLSDYAAIAQSLNFQQIQTADWSIAVAPFWEEVIQSALDPKNLWGVLSSGWSTLQAALASDLMREGYRSGLIRYGLLSAIKSCHYSAVP